MTKTATTKRAASSAKTKPVLGTKWMKSAQAQLDAVAAESPGQYCLALARLAAQAPEVNQAAEDVRRFWKEFEPRLVWDYLPFEFAYELYLATQGEVSWSPHRAPRPVSRYAFVEMLVELVESNPRGRFVCLDRGQRYRSEAILRLMRKPEPLAWEFRLWDWMESRGNQPRYKGYRGLVRRSKKEAFAAKPTKPSIAPV